IGDREHHAGRRPGGAAPRHGGARLREEGVMATAINVRHPERWATAVGGAALLVWGANRFSKARVPLGAALTTTGAGLLWRSARTGTRARLGGRRGTVVEESFAINRSPA